MEKLTCEDCIFWKNKRTIEWLLDPSKVRTAYWIRIPYYKCIKTNLYIENKMPLLMPFSDYEKTGKPCPTFKQTLSSLMRNILKKENKKYEGKKL